ncbi:MAG: TlpA family protein disulfide reductase [Acidobacteria bacterium]|nr:TlpA family protein disulfide reductase [Acidobacteriota bacterium]
MAFGFGRKRNQFLGPGQPAPAFRLTSLEGAGRAREEILAGGPALLAFFKASCPVCQFTLPFLERLAQGGSLRVIGVSQDDAKATARFSREYELTFPMLLDESSSGYATSNAFGITTVPSLFLLEGDGTVSYSGEGFGKRDLERLARRAGIELFQPDDYVPEWKAG